jgi:uncharacterized protein YraI
MRNLSIWLFLALSIAGSQLSAVTIVCQAGAAEYRVNDDVPGGILNLRTGPGVNHDLVVSIPSGSTGVEVTECRSGDDDVSKKSWCRATWKGNHGWVSSCCISQTQNNSLSHSSVIASLVIISEYSRQKSCSKTDTRTSQRGYHTWFTWTYGPFYASATPELVRFAYEGTQAGKYDEPDKMWSEDDRLHMSGYGGVYDLKTNNIGASDGFNPADISRYEYEDEPDHLRYTLIAFCNPDQPCVVSSGWPDRKVAAAYITFCDPKARDGVLRALRQLTP